MPESARAVSYTIRVTTDRGIVVKQGNDFAKLQDDMWSLYEANLCPFCPDDIEERDDEDDDPPDDDVDDTETDLDDEFQTIDPPEPSKPQAD